MIHERISDLPTKYAESIIPMFVAIFEFFFLGLGFALICVNITALWFWSEEGAREEEEEREGAGIFKLRKERDFLFSKFSKCKWKK